MQRLLLVLVLVALCVVAGYGLYAGWRHRASRQAGLYISTTTAGSWQDRIVAQGLGRRSAGAVRLSADGVRIERDGANDIFVPLADLATVTTAPGIAGKVMGMADGVLIVRWSLGGTLLDSGFRADDADAQVHFLDVARSLIAGRSGTGRTTGSPSTN